MIDEEVDELFNSQTEEWPLAKQNYSALKDVEVKKIQVRDAVLTLQFNPARIISSSAKVDKETLAERSCFLCQKKLPKEQRGVKLSNEFTLLVNPFPILRKHFTIVNQKHIPQQLFLFINEMLQIATQLSKEYTIFYNGPRCGASAPDHMHFQAGLSKQFPIWGILKNENLELVVEEEVVTIRAFQSYVNGFIIEGTQEKEIYKSLVNFLNIFSSLQADQDEPMLNVLAKYDKKWQIILFPREKHRPNQYFAKGEEQVLLSPASVDFGGLLAIPLKKDFEKVDSLLLKNILQQLTLNTRIFNQLKEKMKIS